METSWRQKSRSMWLNKGDRCTPQFQRVADLCTRTMMFLVDGSFGRWFRLLWSTWHEKTQCSITNICFQKILLRGLSLSSKLFSPLRKTWSSDLRHFEQNEVPKLVKSIFGNKARHPDGFTMTFHFCWYEIDVTYEGIPVVSMETDAAATQKLGVLTWNINPRNFEILVY